MAGNLELTPGEIISLAGDLYGSPENLANADATKVSDLLRVMDKQEQGQISNEKASKLFQTLTGGRYTKLAADNAIHFARKNRETWLRYHNDALTQASKAKTKAELDKAYLTDAFGSHFLTDAFAAGHLIDVSVLEPAIEVYLRNNPIDTRKNPELVSIVRGMSASGISSKLVLKNVHDHLNREGFKISNNRNMTWKTFGDDHLKRGSETAVVASLAVFLSRQQVTQANAGKEVNPQDILDYLPNNDTVISATNYAKTLIPDAAKEVVGLIRKNTSMLRTLDVPIPVVGKAIPYIMESLIKTISSPGRERQLIEAKERADGGVAPQLTIFEF